VSPDEPPQHRLDPDRVGDRSAEVPGRQRLDPDRAAAAAQRRARRGPPPPVIDTRRYQRMIGLVGLLLVVVISVTFLTTHGSGTAGIPAGQRLHFFSAPLATSNLSGDANANPPCAAARHDPRVLNICLLSRRAPLVLAFFVTRSSGCERQVDALQALSRRYPSSVVQFAAVAVRASHSDARAAVRSHHWTLPVAYDADGAIGEVYGVEVCPIVELAHRGGLVESRLIGEHWNSVPALSAEVSRLVGNSSG
jgi:peroxiredoxin